MIYWGIDPGSKVAITGLGSDGSLKYCRLFKTKEGFPYKEFGNFCETYVKTSDMVCIEDVHSVFSASAKSNYNFGKGVGACHQAVYYVEENYTVQPKIWQRNLWSVEDIVLNDKGKKDTKTTSLNCAKRILGKSWNPKLFLPTSRSKVVNHDMIDSYLIARFLYETKFTK